MGRYFGVDIHLLFGSPTSAIPLADNSKPETTFLTSFLGIPSPPRVKYTPTPSENTRLSSCPYFSPSLRLSVHISVSRLFSNQVRRTKKFARGMRMSCNGCRVLRKGCSEGCSIRPCLQWIKNPEGQSNATLFLAKFYGRAGLMNLIDAGPVHLRPAIFRSLLYEACGRMVNPIYGAVGLLWAGSWQLCQEAVEAVFKGRPITQIPAESTVLSADIRHVCKDDHPVAMKERSKLSKKSRRPFKRSAKPRILSPLSSTDDCNRENEAMNSEESLVTRHEEEIGKVGRDSEESGVELELELKLGIDPVQHSHTRSSIGSRSSRSQAGEDPRKTRDRSRVDGVEGGVLGRDLGFDLPAS